MAKKAATKTKKPVKRSKELTMEQLEKDWEKYTVHGPSGMGAFARSLNKAAQSQALANFQQNLIKHEMQKAQAAVEKSRTEDLCRRLEKIPETLYEPVDEPSPSGQVVAGALDNLFKVEEQLSIRFDKLVASIQGILLDGDYPEKDNVPSSARSRLRSSLEYLCDRLQTLSDKVDHITSRIDK